MNKSTVYIYNSQNALYEVFIKNRCSSIGEVFEALEGKW